MKPLVMLVMSPPAYSLKTENKSERQRFEVLHVQEYMQTPYVLLFGSWA